MNTNAVADHQIDSNSVSVEDLRCSPAKALFRGEIIQSEFWPFPTISPEQKELLDIVVESVDRFLADQQDNFREWDRTGEQPSEFATR